MYKCLRPTCCGAYLPCELLPLRARVCGYRKALATLERWRRCGASRLGAPAIYSRLVRLQKRYFSFTTHYSCNQRTTAPQARSRAHTIIIRFESRYVCKQCMHSNCIHSCDNVSLVCWSSCARCSLQVLSLIATRLQLARQVSFYKCPCLSAISSSARLASSCSPSLSRNGVIRQQQRLPGSAQPRRS